jgi:hypothetical protein
MRATRNLRVNILITLKWWYWLAVVVRLAAGLAGWSAGLPLASAAVAVQIIHFAARMLALASWNRSEPLSWQLVKRTFLTPPVHGSILAHKQLPEVPATFPLRRAS